MALVKRAESVFSTSSTVTSGASAVILAANSERNGINMVVDAAATTPVYILLRTGTASATNFDISLGIGGSWDGALSDNTVWGGAVTLFGTGSKVGVVEF